MLENAECSFGKAEKRKAVRVAAPDARVCVGPRFDFARVPLHRVAVNCTNLEDAPPDQRIEAARKQDWENSVLEQGLAVMEKHGLVAVTPGAR